MQLSHMFVGLALGGVVLTPTPAGALDAPPLPRGRLELRGGLGLRDDQLTAGGQRVTASGSAVSELVAGGAWFDARRPFGVAARLELERFGVRDRDAMPETPALGMFGFDLGAGAAARLARGNVTVEGLAGYALLQVPLARQDGAMPLEAAPLFAHGPLLSGTVALAAAGWLALEATGRVLPLTFGASRDGHALTPRRLAGSAGAVVGRLDRGGLRWSALVLYELSSTGADNDAVTMSQTRQQLSLGLRATFPGGRPAPPALVAAPAPRGRIRGVVRQAPAVAGDPPGAALANVTVTAGEARATTDATGSFTLADLAPGLLRLRLARPGLVAGEEVVAVPAEGEAHVEVTLQVAAEAVPAALIGLVRDEDGAPVTAAVKIVERGLAAQADARGQFRFELPAGRYTLTIEAPGFVGQRKLVRAVPGEQNIYNVDLQRER